MTPKTAIMLALMISMTSAGNLLMKLGSATPPEQRFLFGLLGFKTMLGIAIFAGSVLLYARILEDLPLNVAQSFAALQFVAVLLAANFVLGEPITALRAVGMGLIVAGIVMVGTTSG